MCVRETTLVKATVRPNIFKESLMSEEKIKLVIEHERFGCAVY
jgi:hypothetical protein